MRVLILGATGMLGHKLCQVFRERFDTWGTARSDPRAQAGYGLLDPARTLGGVDVFDFDTVVRSVGTVHPEAIINCVGVVKQLPAAQDPIISLSVNALFPHRLANLCRAAGARLIHLSTDCVFSGRKGKYTEDQITDAEDLYGRTKLLGEVGGLGCLTLRTSIIGRELRTPHGLLEWFLANRGRRVRGYTAAIYSGFSTLVMSRIIADLLEHHPDLSGVYHVASEPIDKYRLLCLVRDVFRLPITIEPSADVQIDRSLDSSRFRARTGYVPPSWEEMIREVAMDPTPYDKWRSAHGA